MAYTYSKGIDNSSGFGQWVNFSNYRLTRALSSYDLTHNFVASYNWAVPFDHLFSGAPKRLTQGWQFIGISRFSSGFPISLARMAITHWLVRARPIRRIVVGQVRTQDPRNPGPNGPNTYFLPDAFASQDLGRFGTANRRFFHGPGILNTDFAF